MTLPPAMDYRRGLLALAAGRLWSLQAGVAELASWPLDGGSALDVSDHGGVGALQLLDGRRRAGHWRFTLAQLPAVQRFVDRLDSARAPGLASSD